MRARVFGLALLLMAGAVPLGVFAYLSISRSEDTELQEVRTSNERLAASVAARIGAYARSNERLMQVIGASALRHDDVGDVRDVLADNEISYPYFKELAAYRANGERAGGRAIPAQVEPLLARARQGTAAHGPLLAPQGKYGYTRFVAEPVTIAGEPMGVVVARVDLRHTWGPLKEVVVGEHGAARLVTSAGILLAHGDPEEARCVFDSECNPHSHEILAAARAGELVANGQGIQVVASAADVPDQDWVVIVERPAGEAYAAASSMKRSLLYFGIGAVVVALVLGVLGGGPLVKSLERLRSHTKLLGRGDLEARIDTGAPVVELEELAKALNDMAGSIQKLHEQAKSRERLSTFARVAAGLAHDLRQPIETVRTACAGMMADPTDAKSRELFEFMSNKELPRLKRYVDDLQRIATVGEVELEPDEIIPLELAESIADDLRNAPKWRTVEFEAVGRARVVVADRNLVRRAVYNLASNASDACATNGPGGRVEIEVADAADARTVEFRVHDNGDGIEPDALARLLSGDFCSTKRSTGVGLGFGVARHVAQAHGGRIEAESEVGVGSTFTVRLPLEPKGARGAGDVDAEIRVGPVVGSSSHATH